MAELDPAIPVMTLPHLSEKLHRSGLSFIVTRTTA
jgi:hypothetical protein